MPTETATDRLYEGISPEFTARLSAEDLNDIAAGDILLGTVQAFEAAAVTREGEDLREHFEERAGILDFDALLPRADAGLEAARLVATHARNRRYLWASLRAALASYPSLLSQLPDMLGPVDARPWSRCSRASAWCGRGCSPDRIRWFRDRGRAPRPAQEAHAVIGEAVETGGPPQQTLLCASRPACWKG